MTGRAWNLRSYMWGRLRGIACLALLLGFGGTAWAAVATPIDDSGVPGTAAPIIDTTTGGEKPLGAGDFQGAIETLGTQVSALTGQIAGQQGLYVPLTTDNAKILAEKVQAQNTSGVGQVQGPGIAFGDVLLTFGGESVDIDARQSYQSAPTTYDFIGQGRNRFGSLDQRMQRSTKWLNKHTCGGFDWSAQFTSMFRKEVLVDYVKNLGEGVIAAAPMALLGAFAPQLAEIVKWLKLTVGFDLSSTKADCSAIENSLTHGIRSAAWSETYANCMSQYTDAKQAMANCSNPETSGALAKSDGTETNPITSQAAATGPTWESNSYNMSKDWIDRQFASDATTATTAQTGAANPSASPQQQNQDQGVFNAMGGSASGAVKNLLGQNAGTEVNSLAKTLFGDFSVGGTGSLELGRKRYKLFQLGIENEAAAMQNSLEAQLLLHVSILIAGRSGLPDLASSYQKLKLWTYHTRGGDDGVPPWTRDKELMGKIHLANPGLNPDKIAVTDLTMDACAYLLNDLVNAQGDPAQYAAIENAWHIKAFLTVLCKYEFMLYISDEMKTVKGQLDAVSKRMSSSGAPLVGADALAAVEQQYQGAMKDLSENLAAIGYEVATHLELINSFRNSHVPQQTPVTNADAGWIPQPIDPR